MIKPKGQHVRLSHTSLHGRIGPGADFRVLKAPVRPLILLHAIKFPDVSALHWRWNMCCWSLAKFVRSAILPVAGSDPENSEKGRCARSDQKLLHL